MMLDSRELRVLLIDDDEEEFVLTEDLLAQAPNAYDLDWIGNVDDGLVEAARRAHDVYLVDYRLGAGDGIDFIRRAHGLGCDGPFILLTGQGEAQTDIVALRAGATDYLLKRGLDPALLGRSIRYAVERHELQERASESMRLEVVGVLASGVAHEYNNQLAGIIGHLSLARDRLTDPAKVDEHLDEARAAADRASDLTRRLLAYAQNFPAYEQSQIDAFVLTERSVVRARLLVGEPFAVDVNVEPSTDTVVGDEELLVELIGTVLVNAYEAESPTAPVLNVHAAELDEAELATFRGSALVPGPHLVVTVKDEGKGMDGLTLQRALDPFYSTKFLGRGLGLAAAGGIAQGHDGGIRIESEVDVGTTVTIVLPFSTVQRANRSNLGHACVAARRPVTTERKDRSAEYNGPASVLLRALRQGDILFGTLFRSASIGVKVVDMRTCRILDANPTYQRLLGYTLEELCGRAYTELTYPDDRAREQALQESVAEGKTDTFHFVKRYVRKGGALVWARVTASVVRDDNGIARYGVSMVEDITSERTAQERTREELRHTAERFRMIADNAQDIIYRLRVGKNPGYDYISPAVTSILGVTPDDFYADPDITLKYLHVDDVESVASSRSSAGQSAPLLIRWHHPDGRLVWLERRTTHSFDEHGNSVAIEGIIRDVTERVAQDERRQSLEAQLRQSQKLEAIGQLAGGIAHDFNNLLLALRGYGELALRRLKRGDHGVQDDILEMLDATDRAASLTHQLLAFGRQQMLSPVVVDLCEVVKDMDKLLRRLIGEQVELVTVRGDEPVLVEVDRSQLEQVIANLAVNGRDAMPDGGRLELEVGIDGSGEAVLSVTDSGCGMDEETIASVFEPYFTTKGENGTGLGLATVHGIVSQSGGHTSVTSKPGKGTTFQIFLPIADGAIDAPAAALLPPEAAGGTESILVIEDDEMVRSIVTAMLEDRGYNVVAVDGSEAAITMVSESTSKFDLVLSDLIMPGLNGRQAFERLRELGCEAKVLYMSGYADDALLGNAPDSPIALIQKPFDGEALARKVREALVQGTSSAS